MIHLSKEELNEYFKNDKFFNISENFAFSE